MTIQNTTIIDTNQSLAQEAIDLIRSKKNITSNPKLKERINALSSDHLNTLINTVVTPLSKEKEGPALVAKFGQILDKNKLEQAAKITDIAQKALDLRPAAKHYFELTEAKAPSATLSILLYRARDCVVSVLESGLDTFNLPNIFNSPADSQTKTAKILALLTLLSALSAILIPLIGLPHGILGIAAVILIIFLVQHLYQYVRPTPVFLANAENWSKKYWEGDLIPSKSPSNQTKELVANLTGDRPVILKGPSGCGKTEMIKSLVKGIEQQEYPHLKRKRLFYVNTVGLSLEQLQNIVQNTQANKNNLIMVFDNLQDSNETLRKQLNIYLKDKHAFPYFIGITTGAPCIDGAATISLASPTEEEMVLILQNAYPKVLVSEDALKTIAAKTANPRDALTLLSRCIHKTSKGTQWLHAREKMYTLALKINGKSSDKDKKTFLLYSSYLVPALKGQGEINEALIEAEASTL